MLADGTWCDLPEGHEPPCDSGGRQRARAALAETCERILSEIDEQRRQNLN